MGVDYPRGWEIARATPMARHGPACSYRTGALLCDCPVLTAHPEYLEGGVLYTRGGVPFRAPGNTP
jgi:hypothetical protein